jgi:precorrin-3B methylase
VSSAVPSAGATAMPVSSPAEVPASASVRLRLAAVARAAALGTRGVVGLDAGRAGMRMTGSAGLRVDGVLCVALPHGRYQVSVHVVAAMVALRPLADAVRARVEHDAAVAGLADRLGPVDVAVEDVQARTEARP